jgi:hypothetical protein
MVHQCQLPDLMERTLMMDDLAIIDTVYNHIIAHPNSELVSKETYKFIFSRKGFYKNKLTSSCCKKIVISFQLIGQVPLAITELFGSLE